MDKSISSKPVVALMIKDQLYSLIFSHIEKELNQEFQIKRVDINKLSDKKYDDLPDLSDVEGCVTSWGTPAIGEDLLSLMPKLKIVAHAAGSVKGIVEECVYRKGISVTCAHMALAPSVAETTLMLTLMGLKLYKRQNERFNKGMSRTEEPVGYELSGKRVGLIGYGRIARLYRKLLCSFDTEVLVYDPYLKPEQLESENVKLVTLDELLSSCHVISLHAPGTKENDSLIDADALTKMMDNTLIVNTARGILIDEDALYNELKNGIKPWVIATSIVVGNMDKIDLKDSIDRILKWSRLAEFFQVPYLLVFPMHKGTVHPSA